VLAAADRLPFPDDSFDAAVAIIALHHWDDVDAGLRKMQRAARRRTVIVMFDPALEADLWIARDYIREQLAGSGRRGSNPRPSAWEADALPTELRPRQLRIAQVR
jgi:ubiquinone/menaquinone biosynthesis C-methylase UbiE